MNEILSMVIDYETIRMSNPNLQSEKKKKKKKKKHTHFIQVT
ncbi:hypothetical protein HanIR_Chr15g0785811 [Helianthus annuus]|nr:hypothetical protein HanIR_Chr15g0785811 [Helianthus annuus]